jgi:hypothetical protein
MFVVGWVVELAGFVVEVEYVRTEEDALSFRVAKRDEAYWGREKERTRGEQEERIRLMSAGTINTRQRNGDDKESRYCFVNFYSSQGVHITPSHHSFIPFMPFTLSLTHRILTCPQRIFYYCNHDTKKSLRLSHKSLKS